jgi:hypothetical protein
MPDSGWYDDLYTRLSGKCPECDRALPLPSRLKFVIGFEARGNPAFMHKNPAAGAIRRGEKRKHSGFEGFDERLKVEGKRGTSP